MRLARTRSRRIACGLLLANSIVACAVGPDFSRPPAPRTERYTREPLPADLPAAEGRAQHVVAEGAVPARWWRLFESDALNNVVEQALANNPTLQASRASLRRSQDLLRAGEGVLLPRADGEATASRARNAPVQQGSAAPGSVFNVLGTSVSVSYPLDVFGSERRTVEGLAAQVDYQRFLGQAAYLSLSANVVDTCIARAASAAELEATGQMIALESQQLQSATAQVDAGTAAYSTVLSLRSLIAGHRAALAASSQQISLADHQLAALSGLSPAEAGLPEIESSAIVLPAALPVTLPSELVRQRPDILAAEAQLHAASADIGVATAAMYPSVGLSASYGAAGSGIGALAAAGGRFWSLGPTALLPIFHGGSSRYQRLAAIDAYDAALADYRRTVLAAFQQVADALKALEHDAQALQAQVEARQAAGEALGQVQAAYQAGLVAYLDVLAADVQFHAAHIAYVQAVAHRQQDTVALFAALGGGWWNAGPPEAEGARR